MFRWKKLNLLFFFLHLIKCRDQMGFTPFLYLKYYTLVGNLVYRDVKAFLSFDLEKLLKEVNQTFIILIPKIEIRSNTNHFRPISLYSTIYKIISKIIANRLIKVVVGRIIHPLDRAYFHQQLIQDNVLIAREVFHSFKNKKGKRRLLAIKLYM